MAANLTLPFPQQKFSSSYLPATETPPKPTHTVHYANTQRTSQVTESLSVAYS